MVSDILLQKFSILSVVANTALISVLPAAMFMSGRMKVVPARLFLFLFFLATLALSVVLSKSNNFSASSAILVATIQFGLIFRFDLSKTEYTDTIAFFANLAAIVALLGIVQFNAQFIVGKEMAFFVDYFMPEQMRITGFNQVIPLYYLSPILKSNGVFFAEPSFFNQFLALGVLTELLTRARWWRLLLICGGLFTSFSGTGLLMLALVLPIYILYERNFALLIYGVVVAATVFAFSDYLPLDGFLRRTDEFSNASSSGYGRFVSPTILLQEFVLNDAQDTLIGRGPGSINEHLADFFDPTWAKLIYEYGLLGFVAYLTFFLTCLWGAAPLLALALSFTYFFLGGYLGDGTTLFLVALLCAWTNGSHEPAIRFPRGAARLPVSSAEIGIIRP